jgi:hypothetical protein
MPFGIKNEPPTYHVATLALGSRPRQRELQGCGPKGSSRVNQEEARELSQKEARESRQRHCKSAGQEEARELRQEEARESHHILPGVLESVRERTLTLPRQLPLWEMESRWTPKTLESDCRGQTSMSCGFLYIIGKILKRRYLKWARIAHLDI